MTFEAECPHIRKIALASPFRYRKDVIGVPQRPAEAVPQIPFAQESVAGFVVQLEKMQAQRDGIDSASGAYTFVPLEHPFAQITGVSAKLPLMNAIVGTKGAAALGNFVLTSPAEGPAIGPFREFTWIDPAAGLGAFPRGHLK